MGVDGLWKLIEPCGQEVPEALLENQILAVGLHQVVKESIGCRGSTLRNALQSLFYRLRKLMYYGIKPVFVFDGKVSTLKSGTVAECNLSRSKLTNEADRIQTLLQQSLAKEQVVQEALGTKATEELLKASPSKNRVLQKRPDIDEIFKLADLPPIKETSGESDLNTTTETTSCSESDAVVDKTKLTFTLSQLENIFSEEPSTLPNRSDQGKEDMQKAIEAYASSSTKSNSANNQQQPYMGDEYDDGLQTVIKRLQNSKSAIKFTKDQRKNLRNGLVKANHAPSAEEFQAMLLITQIDNDEFTYTFSSDDKENTEEETASTSENILSQTHTAEEEEHEDSTSQAKVLSSAKMLTTHNESPVNVEKCSEIVEDDDIELITDSISVSELEEVCGQNSDTTQCNTNLEIFVDASKILSGGFVNVFCKAVENKIELKPSSMNVTNILPNLQKQASEVTKTNLTDIKLDTSIIEISDDESEHSSQNLVIDSDTDAFNESPSSAPKEILESQSAPIDKAAEKYAQSIQTYIPVSVIKRIPEKITENMEDVPKVNSPFFVNGTPKSNNGNSKGKRSATDDEGSPMKKPNKTSNDYDKDIALVMDENDKLNSLLSSVNLFKENKTREELEELAPSLAKEKVQHESERNRQDRITESINSECMKLLRLFGVPFIVAPMEAEAQCAFLDSMQLTNGTITDDSEILLFGGRKVYKNFFARDKCLMEFKADKIESSFNLDRKKLIQIALLVGSDYTTGITGIGAVTALEIVASFSASEAKDLQTDTVLATLESFSDWFASAKTTRQNAARHRLRNRLKNIELYKGFPSPAVVEAYLTSSVDNSQVAFSWGSPDIDSIREFTRTKFGWTRLQTNENLDQFLKKSQFITNYFEVNKISNTYMPSRRVQDAINSMSVDYKSDE